MKLVTAIIQPSRLENVKAALERSGAHGMTVSEASGFGRQKGHPLDEQGPEHAPELLAKIRVEILVENVDAERVVGAVVNAAQTGAIGDGKVWVVPVEDVARVRTGERGSAAL